MSRLRYHKQSRSFIPVITLTPLIDTVLVLLIVFMVTSPSKVSTLPAHKKPSAVQKARSEDYRVSYLYVARDGTIVVNGKVYDLKAVMREMPVLVNQSPIKTVFIKTEDSIRSSKIVHGLVDAVHGISGARVIVS